MSEHVLIIELMTWNVIHLIEKHDEIIMCYATHIFNVLSLVLSQSLSAQEQH